VNIAFIPARSGSKRIKDKNFQKINSKSLLEITLSCAKETCMFDYIFVSSDDQRAKFISESYKVNFIERSEVLSGDKVKIWEVLFDFLSKSKNEFNLSDNIVLLLPTSPNRTIKNIEEGINLINQKKSNVISVSPFRTPIEFSIEIESDNSVDINQNKFLTNSNTQSQSFNTTYFPNGNFFGSKIDLYLKYGTFYANPLNVFKTSEFESIDINNYEDIEFMKKFNYEN